MDEPMPDRAGGPESDRQPGSVTAQRPADATADTDAAGSPTEPEPVDTAPASTAARGRPGLLIGRTLVALVSAVTLAAAGVGWFTIERFRHDTNITNALSDLGPNQPSANDGATDILLVGSDSRTDAQGNPLPAGVLAQLRTEYTASVNTDTIMVLRIPANGGRAYAISIPRDTYVSIPGQGWGKVNSAYATAQARQAQQLAGSGTTDRATIQRESAQAGQRALTQTVQDLTGVHIDHYAELNLYGFYLLSQAVGGVPVCLRHATSDQDSGANFPAGEQRVSGSAALSFVRQRKNLPAGDLSRIVRQQVFLASAMRQLLTAGTLTSPAALAGLLDTVTKSLVTDPDLDILALLRHAQGLIAGDLEVVTIPVTDINAVSTTGQSIVTVDVDQVHQFVANLVGGDRQPVSPVPTPANKVTGQWRPAVSSSTPAASAGIVPAQSSEPSPPVTVDGVRCVD